MNGPEHVREAERLTALALEQWDLGHEALAIHVTLPQAAIHARLAQAAAIIETSTVEVSRGWFAPGREGLRQ